MSKARPPAASSLDHLAFGRISPITLSSPAPPRLPDRTILTGSPAPSAVMSSNGPDVALEPSVLHAWGDGRPSPSSSPLRSAH